MVISAPSSDDHPPDRTPGRGWSWAALGAGVAVWATALPTRGVTLVLAPVGLVLSLLAVRRAPHDSVFWIGLAFNVLQAAGLAATIVSLVT
jgi:hypothetical protein